MTGFRFCLFFFPMLAAFAQIIAEENPNSDSPTLYPYRISARHIEARGVGYTKGYTTIDLLATVPCLLETNWIPLLDGRFHIFDNGRFAANAGLGLRYLTDNYIVGVNAFYDYRNTSHHTYNQFSLGIEALSSFWDFRLNGYLPLGSTKSDFYHTRYSHFSGNTLYLSQRQEFAMPGLNAEAGMHIAKMNNISVYGAFGPYYFVREGRNAIGGEARIAATFLDHLKLELSGSYDPVFHGIVQGEISFVVPFGCCNKVKAKKRGCSGFTLSERALQTIDRNEIVVVTHKTTETPAVHPSTGTAYRFLFVNNLSHSDGTYESPYHTLKDAEVTSNPFDVYYVLAGDGGTTGMDKGIILKDNQKLFGASIPIRLTTTQGDIIIPALSSSLPKITNSTSSVIQLGHNCEVAGIHVTSSDTTGNVFAGILGGVADPTFSSTTPGIQDTFIHENQIEGSYGDAGILLFNSYGLLKIEDNKIDSISSNAAQTGTGIDIYTATSSTTSVTCSILNNSISNTKWNGIYGGPQGSNVTLNISNNNLNKIQGSAIAFQVQSDILNISIIENNLLDITGNGISTFTTATKTINADISNNFMNNVGIGNANSIEFEPTVTKIMCARIANNTILNSKNGSGIFCQPTTPAGCLSITNNLLDSTQGIGINSTGASFSTDIFDNVITNTVTVTSSMNLETGSGGSICAKIENNQTDLKIQADSGVSIEVGSQAVSGSSKVVPKGTCECGCSN